MNIPQPIGEQINDKEAIGEAGFANTQDIQQPTSVPYHTHNGLDSPKIRASDFENASRFVTITDSGSDSVVEYSGSGSLTISTPNNAAVLGIEFLSGGFAISYPSGRLYIKGDLLSADRDLQVPDAGGNLVVANEGSGAPGYTPELVGLIYCDTSGGKVYISTGTTNSSDWKLLN